MRIRPRSNLSNKARSKFSEKRAAETFGGRLQPASGALPSKFMKGDVKSDKFLVDDKVTKHESYSLGVPLWKKLANEAWTNDRRPAMRIAFDSGTTLIVVDELTFREMKAAYENRS